MKTLEWSCEWLWQRIFIKRHNQIYTLTHSLYILYSHTLDNVVMRFSSQNKMYIHNILYISHVSNQHFYNTWHHTFTLHVFKITLVSGVEVTGKKAAKPETTIWYNISSLVSTNHWKLGDKTSGEPENESGKTQKRLYVSSGHYILWYPRRNWEAFLGQRCLEYLTKCQCDLRMDGWMDGCSRDKMVKVTYFTLQLLKCVQSQLQNHFLISSEQLRYHQPFFFFLSC